MRMGRELDRMKKECNMHTNRIKGLLVLHGIRIKGALRGLRKQLDSIRLWDGSELSPNVKADLGRELERLELLLRQRKELKAERKRRLAASASDAVRGHTRRVLHRGAAGRAIARAPIRSAEAAARDDEERAAAH